MIVCCAAQVGKVEAYTPCGLASLTAELLL